VATTSTLTTFDSVRPVLVPVDSAGCPATVVGAAAEVCAGLGAMAILLEVVRSTDGVQRGVRVRGGAVDAVLGDDTCAHLRDLAEVFRSQGVDVSLSVREGDLVSTILAEAQGTGAQMIVMGPHEGAGRVVSIQPSVAETVVQSASVPVMVVRVA